MWYNLILNIKNNPQNIIFKIFDQVTIFDNEKRTTFWCTDRVGNEVPILVVSWAGAVNGTS